MAAKSFIRGRATGRAVKLNTIYKRRGLRAGYRSDETAYPDNFVNPYIGKIYHADTDSEVFSMGMEMLASPAIFAEYLAYDPEYMKIVLGMMLHKNSKDWSIPNA